MYVLTIFSILHYQNEQKHLYFTLFLLAFMGVVTRWRQARRPWGGNWNVPRRESVPAETPAGRTASLRRIREIREIRERRNIS
jgi:hypothetical protein